MVLVVPRTVCRERLAPILAGSAGIHLRAAASVITMHANAERRTVAPIQCPVEYSAVVAMSNAVVSLIFQPRLFCLSLRQAIAVVVLKYRCRRSNVIGPLGGGSIRR